MEKSAPSQSVLKGPRKKIAVVLSGSGYLDGSEITEAVSVLIALSELKADIRCFAPNQTFAAAAHTGTEAFADRNAMTEAARISRGAIADLHDLREKEFDAVIFPGGFGAAKNLSTWATHGANCKVLPEVSRIITEFHRASKPIGAMCIAPTLVAKVLGSEGVTLTIGHDLATANEIEKTGAHHAKCEVTDYISDRDNKVMTTPAYMIEASAFEVYSGVRKMIRELMEMA